MPNATWEDILGGPSLTGIFTGVESGLPNLLPSGFSAGNGARITPVEADTGYHYEMQGERRSVVQGTYGGKPKGRAGKEMSLKPVKLVHTHEERQFSATKLLKLQSGDTAARAMGEGMLRREIEDCKRLVDNHRISQVYSLLSKGKIWYDRDGNMLSSATDAVIEIDPGIPTGNTGGLNWDGSGALLVDWSVASNSIITQLANVQTAALRNSGHMIKGCIYGANVRTNVLKNNEVQAYLARTPGFQADLSRGIIPAGFAGIDEWTDGSGWFSEQEDGTQISWVDPDATIFYAEPAAFFEIQEGHTPISTTYSAGADAAAVASSWTNQQGIFMYAYDAKAPIGANLVYGDTSLPVIGAPKALWIGDTTP